jgi:Ca2+-binding EF-hand superfamily protein
MGNSQNNKMS